MQNLSSHSGRGENVGNQEIHEDYLLLRVHLCQCHLLHETGRRLGDRLRKHLHDVERNDKDISKPVARHYNLPRHFKKHMVVFGLPLQLGSWESRETLERKFIF